MTPSRATRSLVVTPSRRVRAAVALGKAVASLSRAVGAGRGTVISGTVTGRLAPDALRALTRDRRVALITGTNGKTTTTWMTAEAVATQGGVATSRAGANMASGLLSALLLAPPQADAVLEVDEIYLPALAADTRPSVITLMNLSREFTRGVSLARTTQAWRSVVAGVEWPSTIVANADDPTVVWAVSPRSPVCEVVWVGGGLTWLEDVRRCPACGAAAVIDEAGWRCESGDLRLPQARWTVEDGVIRGPGVQAQLHPTSPGGWLWSNMLFAIATAVQMGVAFDDAVRAVQAVDDVDGRYGAVTRGRHQVRLFMVKNPAGWSQALALAGSPGSLVLVMDQFGVKDATPLWDVSIDADRLGRVTVSGHRHADLAARLEAAGVDFTVVPDPLDAIDRAPPGPVNVIVNHSALHPLRDRLSS